MAIYKINFNGNEIIIPQKISQLENDAGFVTAQELGAINTALEKILGV